MYGRLIIKFRDIKNDTRLRVLMSKWKNTKYQWNEEDSNVEIVWQQDNCSEILKFLDEALGYFGKHVYLSLAPERGDYCKEYFAKESNGSYVQLSQVLDRESNEMEAEQPYEEDFEVKSVSSEEQISDATIPNETFQESISDEETSSEITQEENAIEALSQTPSLSDETNGFETMTEVISSEVNETNSTENESMKKEEERYIPSKSEKIIKKVKRKKVEIPPEKENKLEKNNRIAILHDFFLQDEMDYANLTHLEKISFVQAKAAEWGIKSNPMIQAMIYAAIDTENHAKKMYQDIGMAISMNPALVKDAIHRAYLNLMKEKNREFLENYNKKTTEFDFLNIFRREENYF